MSDSGGHGGTLLRRPMKVTVFSKNKQLMKQVFQHSPIRIGRLLENDIPLPFDFVSRFHCELRYLNDEWVAVDLGSKNGLLIDSNTRVKEIRLKEGSQFIIQEVTVRVEFESALDEVGARTSRRFTMIRPSFKMTGHLLSPRLSISCHAQKN